MWILLLSLLPLRPVMGQEVQVPKVVEAHDDTPKGIQDALLGMAPEVDGWDGEVWNQALKDPMTRLSKAVFLGAEYDPDALNELILPAARGLWLKAPPESWLAGEGPWWFHSARALPGQSVDLPMSEGFEQLRQELGGQATHFEWHVESLELKEDQRVETQMHLIILNTEGNTSVGLHGFWRAVWERDEAGLVRLATFRELEREASALRGLQGATRLAGFVDRSASLFGGELFRRQLQPGIDHWRERLHTKLGVGLLGHHGMAMGDINGDGLEDLYVCEPGGLPNRLFLHRPDGSTQEVGKQVGLDLLDFTSSALILDLDGDGDRDLLAATASGLYGFENDGSGRFSKRFEKAGTDLTSLAAADMDGDGDLDIYACRYSSPYVSTGLPFPYHDAENGAANWALVNGGDWKFVDATEELGLQVGRHRFSFAASFEDYDNDGDQDLYVGNDFGRNSLYRNNGGVFESVAATLGVEDLAAGMGVTWADWNRDGFMDLYVSNMGSNAGQRITHSEVFIPRAGDETRSEFQGHARGSSVYISQQGEGFEDATVGSGARRTGWAWGGLAMDLDCDGHSDLIVPNGFVTGESKADL